MKTKHEAQSFIKTIFLDKNDNIRWVWEAFGFLCLIVVLIVVFSYVARDLYKTPMEMYLHYYEQCIETAQVGICWR